MLCNFSEITHLYGCSPVNLQHILRMLLYNNTYGLLPSFYGPQYYTSEFCFWFSFFFIDDLAKKCKQTRNLHKALTQECKIIEGWYFRGCLEAIKQLFWSRNHSLRNIPLVKKRSSKLIFIVFIIPLGLMNDIFLCCWANHTISIDLRYL